MKTIVTRTILAGGAAAAALLLAGCSATHVGESWQCPLAQGASCTSIAEADPAVPAGAARPAMLFGEPLRGARRTADGAVAGDACDGSCGLLAWLRGWFGPGAGNPATGPAPDASATVAITEPEVVPPGAAASVAPASDAAMATDESLRLPEVLGRIWIAPFVDADGIYREAHWVRVVLEPAGWKRP